MSFIIESICSFNGLSVNVLTRMTQKNVLPTKDFFVLKPDDVLIGPFTFLFYIAVFHYALKL